MPPWRNEPGGDRAGYTVSPNPHRYTHVCAHTCRPHTHTHTGNNTCRHPHPHDIQATLVWLYFTKHLLGPHPSAHPLETMSMTFPIRFHAASSFSSPCLRPEALTLFHSFSGLFLSRVLPLHLFYCFSACSCVRGFKINAMNPPQSSLLSSLKQGHSAKPRACQHANSR